MTQGSKMLLKVEGGCAGRTLNTSPPPAARYLEVPSTFGPARRADSGSTFDLEGANGTLRNPHGDGSLQYVAVGFNDLVDGIYDVHVSFDNGQKISNISVVDEDGDDSYISE